MKVFCIVVTYNGQKWIDKCFSSLINSSIPLEIYAIDNASTDATAAELKEKFPQVHLIETGANLGFGKANNIGLKIAIEQKADYVFLLNQDAWIDADCLNTLINIQQSNRIYGIISPLHLSGDNTSLEYKFIEYIQPPVCPGFVSDFIMNKLQPVYETTFVNAAAWLISKDCLQTVGGFDPIYPHYGEDVDYIQRAQYFGFKTGIVGTAKIWHDSKILSWPQIFQNRSRMLTIYLSEVKNIAGSLRSNTLIFIKHRFDDLTSDILYRKFKLFRYRFELFWNTLFKLKKIAAARKASKIKGAFLN